MADQDQGMTYEDFARRVRALLEPTAASKGYNTNGADGDNDLYEFVHGVVGGHGHAIGEIIYKARRYAAKGDLTDVLKIAAWAFLIAKYHRDPMAEWQAGQQAQRAATLPDGRPPVPR